jgi:serine/threonine protein kinase
VVECGPIPEDLARRWFAQLMGGIKYIHSEGVIHRDVKMDNILLDAKGNAKIADFSHAAYTQSDSAQTGCGTLGYMAPEMFSSQQKGPEVDIWSCGVTL